MTSEVKSRFRNINPDNPSSKAMSDCMKIICDHRDLRPVMEYNAGGLYHRGFYEHKDYLLKPNEQFRVLNLPPDPMPIPHPRPVLYNDED